jgi:DnaJ-domain-containing protein 1
MVVECHPDRHQGASDAVRRQATQRMTELNAAYRLLREALLEKAA